MQDFATDNPDVGIKNMIIHTCSNKTCLPLYGTATEDQLTLEQHVVTIGRLSAMTIMLRHNVP